MRIAQIADLHIKAGGALAYDAADTVSALRATVRHLNGLIPQPEVLLIAGDISDDGTPDSYVLTRELLAPLRMPYYLIPGNHDHKTSLLQAFPDHDYFARTDGNGLWYAIDEYAVRLIGLDSVTPGQHGGGLEMTQLNWLRETLTERPDAPTLITLHHPPFVSGIGHMDDAPFRLRHELADVLRRHPQVLRLACGHLHRTVSRQFGGTLATACPGVGMQLALDLRTDAPSGFRLEPVSILLHCLTNSWDDKAEMVTHVSIVENPFGQYGDWHPFFDVISPE